MGEPDDVIDLGDYPHINTSGVADVYPMGDGRIRFLNVRLVQGRQRLAPGGRRAGDKTTGKLARRSGARLEQCQSACTQPLS
jgi:hypothetical protein